MNILLLKRKKGCAGLVTLSQKKITILLLSFFVVLPATFLFAGYHMGKAYMKAHPDDITVALQSELDAQRLQVVEATRDAGENMNAMALKLGQLQAHVIRLDALGQRLTKIAKLDKGEFDFDSAPAVGGPELASDTKAMPVPDFVHSLNELSAQLDDRTKQLQVLESMMMNHNLQKEVKPAGRPVTRGWLSSYFGRRTDPFTGRWAFHSGIDFAGRLGSDIIAVAAGVVTYAAPRNGYGNLVQINHGNGYSTRYGHCNRILVKVGDTVKKGEVIAKMGTTGRSTGPHVHFEVLKNGHAINPKRFIQASR